MKITTSKWILLLDFAVALVLTAAVAVGSFLGRDMSEVSALALAWDGQLTVAVGFYYWKAKNENREKGVQKLITDMAEKYGVESVTSLAEIIYKE